MWQRGWVCTTNQSLDFDRVLYKLSGGGRKSQWKQWLSRDPHEYKVPGISAALGLQEDKQHHKRQP